MSETFYRSVSGMGAALVVLLASEGVLAQEEQAAGGTQELGRGGSAEAESVTYLGVITSTIPEAVRAQVGLAEGVGLLIEHVRDGSPAAEAGLKQNDVLHKLGDQVLVNQAQLRTLIRNQKSGDQIELTVIRGGRPQVLSATLASREKEQQRWYEFEFTTPEFLRERDWGEMRRRWSESLRERSEELKDRMGGLKERLEEMTQRLRKQLEEAEGPIDREKIEQWLDSLGERVRDLEFEAPSIDEFEFEMPAMPEEVRRSLRRYLEGGEGERATPLTEPTHIDEAFAAYSDDEHRIELRVHNGQRHLRVRDREGETVFEGPIDTAEQRAAVPEKVREKLKALERRFHLEGDVGDRFDERPSPPEPYGESSARSSDESGSEE